MTNTDHIADTLSEQATRLDALAAALVGNPVDTLPTLDDKLAAIQAALASITRAGFPQFHDLTHDQQLEHLRTVHGCRPNARSSLGLMHSRAHRAHRDLHHGSVR